MNGTVQLAMVGCHHRLTSLAVRERLSFSPAQTADALAAWRVAHPDAEAVLLSTCNRVELYAAADDPTAALDVALLVAHLADFHNVPTDDLGGQLLTLDGQAVVEHLFRVAASLDSMVVGEAQIPSQVKQAYELASQTGTAGAVTHQLFQAALRVARRVASETPLHHHRVSVPSVAIADFAARVFERFDDKQVLVIGAGKMAHETLQYLADAGAQHVTVLNRDPGRGAELAARWAGQPAAWSELFDEIVAADLVVSTTGADRPIVTLDDYREHVARQRYERPLFVLDLAVPRDFEPAIADEHGVYLYAMDDLTEACQRNRAARAQALPAAEGIVAEETATLVADLRHRATGPVIARLRAELETAEAAELERLFQRLPSLDEQSRQEITHFADRLLGKMLHPPLESLRDESRNGPPHGLLRALERLFQLKE